MAPVYIRELLELKPLSRYALRSDTQNLLKVPRTKCKTFGDRAFAVAGPRVNQLPFDIGTSATVNTFKNIQEGLEPPPPPPHPNNFDL